MTAQDRAAAHGDEREKAWARAHAAGRRADRLVEDVRAAERELGRLRGLMVRALDEADALHEKAAAL